MLLGLAVYDHFGEGKGVCSSQLDSDELASGLGVEFGVRCERPVNGDCGDGWVGLKLGNGSAGHVGIGNEYHDIGQSSRAAVGAVPDFNGGNAS